ncbi:MAG: hypothetical protein KDC87_07280 [Planctomycetes bacterium]|nr:hypothetical protein [Planctomycetota bacterium]MCB9868411.1 hypothetical protein [Planctomycetota bacterium]
MFTRGRSSKQRLAIDWEVPVPEKQHVGKQTVAAVKLDMRGALAKLAGADRRPLLVLRECTKCRGTDDALLTRSLDNERTMLLTGWFHCVRLPATVRERSHPLRVLFADRPDHVLFATFDGSQVHTLRGDQTQAEVWKTMSGLLRASYKRDAVNAVKDMLELLNQFDTLDSQDAEVSRRLDDTLEKRGPKSPQFRRLKSRHDALQAKRKELLAREKKLRDLQLK